MKFAAADPISRKATSACTLAWAKRHRQISRSGGSTARPRTSPSCRGTDRNHPGRQRHHQETALYRRQTLASGLRFVPLSASQHLPHKIVLRKDFEILFKRFMCLRILFCIDEAHHQHLPCHGVEWVQFDCLLESGEGLPLSVQGARERQQDPHRSSRRAALSRRALRR